MQLCTTIDEMRASLRPLRDGGQSIGFVPTMGALHQGHMRLVARAREMSDYVVVSIFVNPKQFGANEDFDKYPRTLEQDRVLLKAAKVAYCFAPSTEEMWPQENETIVEPVNLANILMGALRPGHFRGVATVVAKLFNIIQPHFAFFGEKDFQQLALIRRMVKDLNFPIDIIGVPIARDGDGVAQSSRNALLTSAERAAAVIIPQAMTAAAQAFDLGERRVAALIDVVRTVLVRESLAHVESIDIRDGETLAACGAMIEHTAVLLLTVRFGQVRLIDQHIFKANREN